MELTLDQALQKGIEAQKAGKIQDADRYYTVILKAQPKHPDANHNMGVLAVGVGKVQEALPFFKIALEANPNIEQFWLSYIDALIKLNRKDDARNIFDQAKSIGLKGDGFDQFKLRLNTPSVEVTNEKQKNIPNQPSILDDLKLEKALRLAKRKIKLGLSEEAEKIYNDILEKFPRNNGALSGMKLLASKTLANTSEIRTPPKDQLQSLIHLYNRGHYQKTLTQALELIKKFPNSINLYNIIGAAYQCLGQLDKAIEAYNTAIFIKPDYADTYNNMGITLQEKGKLEEAIKAYNKATSIKPDYSDAYNNMGNAFKEIGKLDKAIEAYNKATSIKPDYANCFYNMGNAFKEIGKLDKAIEAYTKTISIKPDYVKAYNNLGNTLQDQGKLEKAIEAYTKAISIKPDYPDAYNNMGNALKEIGKLDKAIEAYTKAISLRPDYGNAYTNLGNSLQEKGMLDEAIKAHNRAVYIKPHSANAFHNLGNALQEKSMLDEAIIAYEKALSIQLDFAEAYNNMGNALREQGKLEKAIEAYTKTISLKPDYGNAKHMLSALTGKTSETAPREYVENLFDGYSKNFEDSLVNKLEYKLPKLIRDIIINLNSNELLGSVLDLGCGTGLLGSEIKNHCTKLEGIDLSNKMLAIAERKNIYDKLSQFDIVKYLFTMPLDFDYYIASDVFIYIGELTEIFRLIKSRNKKTGRLVFSTEHTELDGYHILKSGRYSHSKSYIENLCQKFGYQIFHFSTTELRKEKSSFLTGGIYILEFSNEI